MDRIADRLTEQTFDSKGYTVKIPESTRSSLTLRLIKRQRERWPQLKNLAVRSRSNFAYVDGVLPDGEQIPLRRLRYGRYASEWGFAIYLGSSDKYQDSFLPSGSPMGEPAEALDCACGLYLGDPSAWVTPRTRTSAGDHRLGLGSALRRSCIRTPCRRIIDTAGPTPPPARRRDGRQTLEKRTGESQGSHTDWLKSQRLTF